MSVYRKKYNGISQETYFYKFEIHGRRFSGTTGEVNKQKALTFEKLRREEALVEIRTAPAVSSAWVFGQAVKAYFEEKMGGELNDTTKPMLIWLQDNVGIETHLSAINTSFVARLVSKKAIEPGAKKGTKVSNATINRMVVEPLRRILRYALLVHEKPHGKIIWKEVLRKEPKERVRELRNNEEADVFENMRNDYDDLFRFAMTAGLRMMELVDLTWDRVDFQNKLLWMIRKGGVMKSIPLGQSMIDILKPLVGHHPEYVFTFVAKKTVFNKKAEKQFIADERYPFSKHGLKSAWRRLRSKAGIKDFRFHDFRHTAGSRILRGTGNLKIVQTTLGHEDIKTTMRYAHVLDEDVAAGIDKGAAQAVTRKKTVVANPIASEKKIAPESAPKPLLKRKKVVKSGGSGE